MLPDCRESAGVGWRNRVNANHHHRILLLIPLPRCRLVSCFGSHSRWVKLLQEGSNDNDYATRSWLAQTSDDVTYRHMKALQLMVYIFGLYMELIIEIRSVKP